MFLSIPVDVYTMDQTVDLINLNISKNIPTHQGVVNAAKIVPLKRPRIETIIIAIINPDGQSVVWASRYLSKPHRERVTGIYLMEGL